MFAHCRRIPPQRLRHYRARINHCFQTLLARGQIVYFVNSAIYTNLSYAKENTESSERASATHLVGGRGARGFYGRGYTLPAGQSARRRTRP